ncbi:MAG: Gfo/Idh/MocA family protein, partial [Cetobacterium sp.]
ALVIENWIDAIEGKDKLIAPGIEGIKALELINSMILSTFLNKEIDLPIDKNLYYDELMKRCTISKYKKRWSI